jgi:hypothetical protein
VLNYARRLPTSRFSGEEAGALYCTRFGVGTLNGTSSKPNPTNQPYLDEYGGSST